MLEEISHRHLPASTQGMSEVVATGGFESGNGCGILRPLRHPPGPPAVWEVVVH